VCILGPRLQIPAHKGQPMKVVASPYSRSKPSFWFVIMIAVVGASLLLSAAGVVLKSQIVSMLPAADEKAGPPTGILTFLDGGIDSWKPMKLASKIFHSPAGDNLYETLRAFQLSGAAGAAGDLSQFSDTKKFQYPLTSLLPLELLETIGLGSVRSLNLINLFMFAATVIAIGYLSCRPLHLQATLERCEPDYAFAKRAFLFAVAVGVSLTFYPAFNALVNGNIQLWINCLFAFTCLAWVMGLEAEAGILVALATAVKPQLGALLLWATLWRRWYFCAGFLGAAIPVALISIVYFGMHNNASYLELLATIARHGERLASNESINGMLHRFLEEGGTGGLVRDVDDYAPYRPIVHALTTISAIAFALMAFMPSVLRRAEDPTIFDFATASICFTIGSPIVWLAHYGILLPLFVIAFKAALCESVSRHKGRIFVLLGIAWLLCATYLPFVRLLYRSPWNLGANPHFFGALILLFLLFHMGKVWPTPLLPRLGRLVLPRSRRGSIDA
jgi:Glycosyltransferase family 87